MKLRRPLWNDLVILVSDSNARLEFTSQEFHGEGMEAF